MKKAKMKINFQNDTINAFGENMPLLTTTSRYYAIPLTQAKQVINNIDRESSTRVTLMIHSVHWGVTPPQKTPPSSFFTRPVFCEPP